MDSADASERKWACVTVANIIHNDPSTRRLLQGKDVIAALIKRLSDNEEEVVREAMGALRYVSRCLIVSLTFFNLFFLFSSCYFAVEGI